jgi:hypothetical protein
MTSSEADDPTLWMLARLPSVTPSAESVDRVRSRCHAVLAQRQQQSAHTQHRVSFRVRLLDATLVGGLCVYLAEVVQEAFRLSGF